MIPEGFSDEWFELMQDWEGEHFDMVEEYHLLLKYRDAQWKVEQFPPEVRDRICSGG